MSNIDVKNETISVEEITANIKMETDVLKPTSGRITIKVGNSRVQGIDGYAASNTYIKYTSKSLCEEVFDSMCKRPMMLLACSLKKYEKTKSFVCYTVCLN
jgi:hypothetical protein